MKTALRSQQGYSLFEMAIVLALMTATIAGSLTLAQYSRRLDEGRSVGEYMLELNYALVEYKTQYKDALMAMPAECSQSTYGLGQQKTAPAVGVFPAGTPLAGQSLCSLKAGNNYVISNGMQPTFNDLKSARILNSGSIARLKLETDSSRRVAGANYALGTSEYGFLLQRQCKAENCDPATGPYNLLSMVFNIQPYRIDKDLMGSGARVGAALADMKGKGYFSPIGGDGTLRNYLNQESVTNPIQDAAGNGVAGILAAYDGWSMGNERFTYRDGTRPPTSDWDFNNKSLASVNAFSSKSATIGTDTNAPVSDRLPNKTAINNGRALLAKGNIVTTGNSGVYTRDLDAGGDAKIAGNMRAGSVNSDSDVIGQDIVANNRLATIGTLGVGGTSTFMADVTINGGLGARDITARDMNVRDVAARDINASGFTATGQTNLGNLKMNPLKKVGDSCNTNNDSFARNQDKTDALLICNNGQWAAMKVQTSKIFSFNNASPNFFLRIRMTYVDVSGNTKTLLGGLATIGPNPSATLTAAVPEDSQSVHIELFAYSSLSASQYAVITDVTLGQSSFLSNKGCYTSLGNNWSTAMVLQVCP